MINLSKAFRRELFYNRRNYLAYADITLTDNTVLHLTNTELWSGGFEKDDAVSGDDTFSALGSTIIGSATIVINNMDESYSDYDFTDAAVVLYIGMELDNGEGGTRLEKPKMGTYTVDDAKYNGSTITLNLLDHMAQFDRPYSISTLTYPATLDFIVRDACTRCGVQLNTYDFPHKDYVVDARPAEESTTFREVIGWAAAIAGCFARCDRNGKLELKWFNRADLEAEREDYDGGSFDSSTPYYSTGVSLNGGSFNPWNLGDVADGGAFTDDKRVHYIGQLYSQNISVDDVIITGIRITVKDEAETGGTSTKDYTAGHDGYVISIANNEFITTSTAQSVASWLGQQLIGLTFRKASVTHANNPAIEAGDVALLFDRKNREYPILVTRTTFKVGNTQTTVCGAETPGRNSATRRSWQTKSYVTMRRHLRQERTAREVALQNLSNALASHSGLYTTIETPQSGGNIFYMHDMPTLQESSVVWKMTADAWGVTDNYNGTQTVWNGGMTVDGDAIVRILSAIGINADWINTGSLVIEDNQHNVTFFADCGTGYVLINADVYAKSLTAEDYVYVDSKVGSFFRIKTQRTASARNYFKIDTNGCEVSDLYYRYYLNSNLYERHNISTFIGAYNAKIPQYNVSESQSLLYKGITSGIVCADESTASSSAYTDYARLTPGGIEVVDSASRSRVELKCESYPKLIAVYNNKILFSVGFGYVNVYNASFYVQDDASFDGNLTVAGTKSRVVETEDYSDRLLYCYETPSPMFGDIGEGEIGGDGYCYISLDPVFVETISTTQYQVFLQKYGQGECYVAERHGAYFVVRGTPGLPFGWELKAKQAGYTEKRLDRQLGKVNLTNNTDYAGDALKHINDIIREREIA